MYGPEQPTASTRQQESIDGSWERRGSRKKYQRIIPLLCEGIVHFVAVLVIGVGVQGQYFTL
jgi:hypothetical protein